MADLFLDEQFLTTVLLTGIVAGCGHVLLGPDHVAALGPFSVEAHQRAWRVGLRWGAGHALGTRVAGAASARIPV